MARDPGGEPGAAEDAERRRADEGRARDPPRAGGLDAARQRVEPGAEAGVGGAHRLGREAVALGGEGRAGGRAGQQRVLEPGEAGLRVPRRERVREDHAGLAVVRAAGREDRHELGDQRLVVGGDGLGEQPLRGQLGLGAERGGEGRRVEAAGEGFAVAGDLEQQQVGVGAAEVGDDGGEGLALGGDQLVEHLLAQRLRLAVVEHGELRRDAGLEREAAQQALAEGVDRLDPEAARRLERAGEERAGAVEAGGRDACRRARRGCGGRRAGSASSSIAQAPRVRNSRFCISAAAALV